MVSNAGRLEALVEEVWPVVTTVMRRRFRGASLSASDDRYENERARDCFQRAMEKLIAKFTRVIDGTDPPIRDVRGYAARVADNAATDEIRPPHWTRLTNRLRRTISASDAFTTWEDPERGHVAGFVGWQGRRASGSVPALRQAFRRLRADVALDVTWESFALGDWAHLLEQVFTIADGPLPMRDLTAFIADLLGIVVELQSLDAGEDTDEPQIFEPVERGLGPHALKSLRDELSRLWSCIRGLRREWRLAYLLNPPGAVEPTKPPPPGTKAAQGPGSKPRVSGRSTARGRIDVFVVHGIASYAEIGTALELTHEDYATLREALPRAAESRDEDSIFALWPHLPLSDRIVGQLLGGVHVPKMRSHAVRQLASCMTALSSGRQGTRE
jgi:hypothetical protein